MSDSLQSVSDAEELVVAAAVRAAFRRLLGRTKEAAAIAELTPQRYDLLLMIKASPGEASTVSELTRRLSLSQTAVTELVNRAVDAGLLARTPSPVDRRVTLITLSAEGERRLGEAFDALRDAHRELADSLRLIRASYSLRNDAR